MNSVYTIISGGPPFGTAPTHQADGRIFFCEPHSFPSPVCDIVGDAQRASRYALRASRSVVVSLRLSRRYAASESEPVMYVVYITFQAGRPSGRPLRATSHELRTTKKALENSSAFFTRISGFLSSQGASPQVLSAFAGLTAVFGMGTGGSPQLSPLNCYVIQDSYPDNCIKMFFLNGSPTWRPLPFGRILCLSQVLGLLVPVRSVHRCTSTPGLSTTSSLWDLTC